MSDTILLCIVVKMRVKYGYVNVISEVKNDIKNSGTSDNKSFFSIKETEFFISLEIKCRIYIVIL